MENYILLIHENISAYQGLSQTEIEDMIVKMGKWSQNLKKLGAHQGASKLTDDAPIYVSKTENELIVDGPFVEAKELLGGFFFVSAENFDQAVKFASECPSLERGGRIEVRKTSEDCAKVFFARAN